MVRLLRDNLDENGASISFGLRGFLDCRVGSWPAATALSVEGLAAAIALDIHLQDRGVMNEAIDGGERHSLVGEDFSPFAERLIGRDQHGSPLVSGGDQLEQYARFGLILGDVGDVVEDEQIVAVELGGRAFEGQLATSDLELFTRSVVRANITRHPFSTRASPSAADRWLLPPPGGPNSRMLEPFANQASPDVSAIT